MHWSCNRKRRKDRKGQYKNGLRAATAFPDRKKGGTHFAFSPSGIDRGSFCLQFCRPKTEKTKLRKTGTARRGNAGIPTGISEGPSVFPAAGKSRRPSFLFLPVVLMTVGGFVFRPGVILPVLLILCAVLILLILLILRLVLVLLIGRTVVFLVHDNLRCGGESVFIFVFHGYRAFLFLFPIMGQG